MSNEPSIEAGQLLDERLELTLAELCRACAVHADLVIDMVAEGIIEPRGRRPGEWRFRGPSVTRVCVAVRLQRDLDLNLAGVALAVELLDEIDNLRRRLRLLEPSAHDI